MEDNFFRVIDYLRLSVTDRCNLRCVYCMPASGLQPFDHSDILSYEEIIRIVRVAARLGVRKVRITGGEPLTRKNLSFLVSSLKKIEGIEDLSMTTNGILLDKYAQELSAAGLDRVNISLDSFNPDRYRQITRGGDLSDVLRGIEAAEKAGLRPLKINMVPLRGVNDDEIEQFARMTLGSEYHFRFIEFMPSGVIDTWEPGKYITTEEMKEIIGKKIGPLTPVKLRKNGPSKYFRLQGAKGVIGFISALSHHFCGECNRLRLTSEGKLRPCLFSETEIDLRSPLRTGADDAEIERLLRLSIAVKPEGHNINAAMSELPGPGRQHNFSKRPMPRIGG
ncbi:MAG: GTP 3',8-cyclase MoaA [Nitrospirae bacterium]|nr:GTP 3',8-cyclase MoaA [Nitrospirota bacterium]